MDILIKVKKNNNKYYTNGLNMFKIINLLGLFLLVSSCGKNTHKDPPTAEVSKTDDDAKTNADDPNDDGNKEETETEDEDKTNADATNDDGNKEEAETKDEALQLYNQALNGSTIDKADTDALVNAYNALDALTDKTGSIVVSKAIFSELMQRVTNKIAEAKKLHDDLTHDLPYKKTFADAIKKAEEDSNKITDAQGVKTLLEEIHNAMGRFNSADRMQAEAGYPVDPADAKNDGNKEEAETKDEGKTNTKATNNDGKKVNKPEVELLPTDVYKDKLKIRRQNIRIPTRGHLRRIQEQTPQKGKAPSGNPFLDELQKRVGNSNE